MEVIQDKTLGAIVASDYRAAEVFEKYDMDFCCNGNRSIKEAAEEKKMDWSLLAKEIEEKTKEKVEGIVSFDELPLDLLSDFIVKTYHKRAMEQIGVIKPLLNKICKVHGHHHEELFEIKALFDKAANIITTHQKKEEIMLYPFIKRMVKVKENNENLKEIPAKRVDDPVHLLTEEHTEQGAIFKQIAQLSQNYRIPADGCHSYKVTFDLLKEFEQDLHKHIHLENNILFPKALKLKEELTA